MPTLNTTTTSNNNNMYSSSNNNSSSNSNMYTTQVQSPTTGYAVKRVLTSSSHPAAEDMPMAVEVCV